MNSDTNDYHVQMTDENAASSTLGARLIRCSLLFILFSIGFNIMCIPCSNVRRDTKGGVYSTERNEMMD